MENTQHLLSSLIQNPNNKSFEIDQLLNIDYQTIELSIKKKYENSYQEEGLNDQGLYTSYYDYYQILKELDNGEEVTICDLGAGLSRISIVAQICFPKIKVITIEHVEERVAAAKSAMEKLGLDTSHIHCLDLEKSPVPKASVYFLYWPVCSLLDRLLDQINNYALEQTIKIVAIESHGDFIFHLGIRSKFLELYRSDMLAVTPRHDQKIYFYQSRPVPELFKLKDDLNYYTHQLENNLIINVTSIPDLTSFLLNLRHRQDILIRIKENHPSLGPVEWVALLEEVELFYDGKTLVFKYPRRHVLESDITAIIMSSYLPDELIEKMRNKKIGKVFVSPNTFYEEI